MRKAHSVINNEISITSAPYTFESDYYGSYMIQPEPYAEFNLLGNKSDYKFLDVGTGKFFSTDYGSGLSLSTTKQLSSNSIKFIGESGSSAGNILSRKIDSLSSSATVFATAYIRKDAGTVRFACGSTNGGSEYGYKTITTSPSFARYSVKCSSVNPDNFYVSVRKTDTSSATVYIDAIVVIDLTGKTMPESLQTKYSQTLYSALTETQLEEIFGGDLLMSFIQKGYAIPEVDGEYVLPGNEIVMEGNYVKLAKSVHILDFSASEISAEQSGSYMHIYIDNNATDIYVGIDSMSRLIKKASNPTVRGIDYDGDKIHISLLMSEYGLTAVNKYDARRVLNGYIYSSGAWKDPQTLVTVTAEAALSTISSKAFKLFYILPTSNIDIDATVFINENSGTFNNIYMTPSVTLYPLISGFSVRDIVTSGIRKHRHIFNGNILILRDRVIPYYWDYALWDTARWN